jgi:hypothetical protein
MLKEYCDTCGDLESNHQANQAESERFISTVREVISMGMPERQAQVLDQILYDWRTHTLPACDPLSID